MILCMFNSCVNPCIFLLSNKIYRKSAKEMFRKCTGLLKTNEISLEDFESRDATFPIIFVRFVKGNSMEEDKVVIFENPKNSLALALPSHERLH